MPSAASEASAWTCTLARRLVWFTLCLPACDQPSPPVASTPHFDVYLHPGAPLPCLGDYDAIEQLYTDTSTALGLAPPEQSIPLHIWSLDAPDYPCSDDSAGCLRMPERELHARVLGATLSHEVVHAATVDMVPLDTVFFSEGLAEAMSHIIPRAPGRDFDPRVLATTTNNDFDYTAAAVFVAFVLDRHGPEAALTAFSRVQTRGLQQSFLDATGADFDQLADAFMQEEFSCGTQLLRCRAPGETLEQQWRFDRTLTCGSPQTSRLGVDTNLHVATGGTFEAQCSGATVFIERCAACPERASWSCDDGQLLTLELSPGDYAVHIFATSSYPRIDFTLSRVN